jgi:hypothetical protein
VTAPSTPDDAWTAWHCHALERLFATCGAVGARAAEHEDAEVALALTSLAGQLAWHAELLYDLLPSAAGADRVALVASRVAGTDDALDALDEMAGTEGSGVACVVLARVVVPRLLSGVASARARVDARIDGPRARALDLIIQDLRRAAESLESLAEAVLGAPGALDAASTGCVVVERALVAAGVVTGLVPCSKNARGG